MPNSFILSCTVTSRLPCRSNGAAGRRTGCHAWLHWLGKGTAVMWVRASGRLSCVQHDHTADVLWAALRHGSVQKTFHKYETVLSHIPLWPCKWAMLIPVPVIMCWQQSWEKENGQSLILVGFWPWFPGSSHDPSGGAKHEQSDVRKMVQRDIGFFFWRPSLNFSRRYHPWRNSETWIGILRGLQNGGRNSLNLSVLKRRSSLRNGRTSQLCSACA